MVETDVVNNRALAVNWEVCILHLVPVFVIVSRMTMQSGRDHGQFRQSRISGAELLTYTKVLYMYFSPWPWLHGE